MAWRQQHSFVAITLLLVAIVSYQLDLSVYLPNAVESQPEAFDIPVAVQSAIASPTISETARALETGKNASKEKAQNTGSSIAVAAVNATTRTQQHTNGNSTYVIGHANHKKEKNYHFSKSPLIPEMANISLNYEDLIAQRQANMSKVDVGYMSAPGVFLHGRGKYNLKVPLPIFVASLPKSGTTTTNNYFACGGIWSKHTFSNMDGKVDRIGKCMLNNMIRGYPVFEGCGGANVWSDTGIVPNNRQNKCFYPTIHGGLDKIYHWYPNATIVNVIRDPYSWTRSATEYHGMRERWGLYCQPDFPRFHASDEELAIFYNAHTEHIREFARTHPSMTYVEVPLESNQTGALLEEKTGIPAKCWGVANRQKKNPKSQ